MLNSVGDGVKVHLQPGLRSHAEVGLGGGCGMRGGVQNTDGWVHKDFQWACGEGLAGLQFSSRFRIALRIQDISTFARPSYREGKSRCYR